MIEKKIYHTVKELSEALGINRNTFTNNRDYILEEMNQCYDMEVNYTKTGRISSVVIKDIYYDYEYENPKEKRVKERRELVKQESIEIIHQKPLNTYSGVARDIMKNGKVKFYTESFNVLRKDTGKILAVLFGREIEENPVWEKAQEGRIGYIESRVMVIYYPDENEYREFTEEQEKDWKELGRKYFGSDEAVKYQKDIMAEFDAGVITEKQKDEFLKQNMFANWNGLKLEFRNKWGGNPMKVNKYVFYQGVEEGEAFDFAYSREGFLKNGVENKKKED